MKLSLMRLGVLATLLTCPLHVDAALVHKYNFNDGTPNDIVGTADGTLIGTATVGGFGRLNLTGGPSGNSYLDLPNGIATTAIGGGTAGAFSFEAWARATTNADWASLISFGGATNHENDTDGANKDYIQLIPRNGQTGTLRATTHAIANGTEGFVDYTGPLSTSADQHIVVVVNQSGGLPGTIDLYVDNNHIGQSPIATGLNIATMVDNNNWLGRSQWGDASFNGSYDEFRIYDHALSAGEVNTSFNIGPDQITVPLTPVLTVDRDSGSMMLQGGQTAQRIVGYSITSAFGSLNPSGWTPITDSRDAPPSGNGSFDSNDEWTRLSAAGSHTDFSEFEFDGGDGGVLNIGAFLPLSSSNGWIKSPTEDLVMNLKLDNGSTLGVEVVFEGNDDSPYSRSDLNFDGNINASDWPLFRNNHETDLSGFSLAEAYSRGDLDGDGDNDYFDFVVFQADFDQAAGAKGALAALIASVPEPNSAVLLIGLATACWAARRDPRNPIATRLS